MGHPARECGIKDEMYKKSGQYGPWLRASSFKKSTTQSASQRSSPVAGALDGNPKNPRRHVTANPWNEDIINKSLTYMEISASQKRKHEIEDFPFPLIPNKRMLREKILEGAAREKFVRETIRKFDEETGLLEFGRDPFGKRIIPSFTSSPSLSLTEIDDIQCDEDAKFSLSA
ncbi:hypothetical protein V6N12_044282 [Hibiscus sabdariffa]|uniref:Uncharacterized protein n=1 Tax=Hibiscus sabdariffa TaxID=183260 RepID=A0ABR2DGT7_9ROSI